MAGRALILTGPSGVGKTTVAILLQRILADPWLFYEVDRAQPRVPQRADFITTDNDRRIRRANLLATRAYLDSGFSTIIEQFLTDRTDWETLDETMSGIDTTVFLLTCTAATLERNLANRERNGDVRTRANQPALLSNLAVPGG